MIDLQAFFRSPAGMTEKAAILARGCGLAYGVATDAERETFRAAIGAQSFTQTAQSGFQPAYTLYTMTPTLKILCFSGTTNFLQGLAYWCMSDVVPWTSTSTNPPASHYINRFVRETYYGMRTALYTALRLTGAGSTADQKILLCGHSLGGAIATLLAADLHTFPTLGEEVPSVHLFGAPRVGESTLDTWLPTTTFNYRNERDPLPLWPEDVVQIVVRYSTYPFEVSPYNIRVEYGPIGREKQIWKDSITEYHFRGNWSISESLALLENLAMRQALPEDHEISLYVRNLIGLARARLRLGVSLYATEMLSIMDRIEGIPITPVTTVTEIPAPSLPSLSGTTVIDPPTPSGATMTRSLTSVAVHGGPQTLILDRPVSAKRARPGDGRVKRVCKKIRELMEYVDWHDAAVAAGTRKSTMYLQDPGQWTPELAAAWQEIYLHLCGKENGTIGS